MIRAALCLLFLAGAAVAQQAVQTAPGAILRGLDKVSGEPRDIEIASGDQARFGSLSISLGECRYPDGNPAGEAYAFLSILDVARDEVMFEGWMIASSPAISAMDHPRYDIWVLRCRTS